MGYSLAIRTRSPALGKRMTEFMAVNYRVWNAVRGAKDPTLAYSSLQPTDDLSYDRAKSALGFDYGVMSGWERVYVYSVTRWLALKVGTRRSRFKEDTVSPALTEPVPFIVYDGDDSWPVLVVEQEKEYMALPKRHKQWAVDRYGVYWNRAHSSVIHACFDLYTDEAAHARMGKELAKIGDAPRHEDPNQDLDAFDKWLDARHVIMAKHMKPEIDRFLPMVRAELKRLDKLWEKLAEGT